MHLSWVVDLFRRVGARCDRIKPGVFECVRNGVSAIITRRGITILVPGEIESKQLKVNGVPEPELLEYIRRVTDADSADFELPGGHVFLKLRYSLDDAFKAAKVFEKIADNALWFSVDLSADISFHRDLKKVTLGDWLESMSV